MGRIQAYPGEWGQELTFGAGSSCFYRYRELMGSAFEELIAVLEREKESTGEICRQLSRNPDGFVEEELGKMDQALLLRILELTRNRTMCWKKIGMPDRRRMYSTTIEGNSGRKTTIKIKPVCLPMSHLRWQRNETPFLLVLEIPNRKIPFIMGTPGYQTLNEIILAAKGFAADHAGTRNMLLLLDRTYGRSETEDDTSNECYFSSMERVLLDRLSKLTRQGCIAWNQTYNGDYSAMISSSAVKINRYWVESVNQIGADPLVLELKIPGRTFFTFWGTEYGSYISDILSFLWKHEYQTESDLCKKLNELVKS